MGRVARVAHVARAAYTLLVWQSYKDLSLRFRFYGSTVGAYTGPTYPTPNQAYIYIYIYIHLYIYIYMYTYIYI